MVPEETEGIVFSAHIDAIVIDCGKRKMPRCCLWSDFWPIFNALHVAQFPYTTTFLLFVRKILYASKLIYSPWMKSNLIWYGYIQLFYYYEMRYMQQSTFSLLPNSLQSSQKRFLLEKEADCLDEVLQNSSHLKPKNIAV